MRMIVISNRLPLTIKKVNEGFTYKETSGGLVTGLKAAKSKHDFIWLGNISGLELTEEDKETITNDCWKKYRSIPVFIDKKLNELSYNGFCNGILWPLLHSFPDDVTYDPRLYDAYKEYNQIFCETIYNMAEEGDVIWVHDYHLMLLPEMLRIRLVEKLQVFSIGFFLHIPFSSYNVFGTLPCSREIVQGMLGSDHISFHTYDYIGHFLETCRFFNVLEPKKMNLTVDCGFINYNSRKINCKAVPIGIDPKLFKDTLLKKETIGRIEEIREQFKGKKIIIGVDRTDYIKGIPNRIKGFQTYLENPDSDKNVVFIQVCVPSRLDVPEYGSLMDRINQMASELNGAIGKVGETFFYILNKSIPFEELCALYAVSDVCCVSSLVDGMNLVALEYTACQDKNKGILMLSEFAGCASTLPASLFINPWNKEDMAAAFDRAIKMDLEERKERHEINVKNVETFTAVKWAEDSVKYLKELSESALITKHL